MTEDRFTVRAREIAQDADLECRCDRCVCKLADTIARELRAEGARAGRLREALEKIMRAEMMVEDVSRFGFKSAFIRMVEATCGDALGLPPAKYARLEQTFSTRKALATDPAAKEEAP